MRACGQKLVKFCTLTHAAKLVVRMSVIPVCSALCTVYCLAINDALFGQAIMA